MKVEIVSIGDELLLAEILDTNASYLARCLRELAVDLTARVIVGDQQALIADALATGLNHADVVIASGGLGIHSDDFTRQAVADVTNQNLTREPPGISHGIALGPPTSVQGLLMETEQGTLICLPGNQRDMSYLVQTDVLPYLQGQLPADGVVGWILLRTAGLMESSVREMLAGLRLQPGEKITYTSYAGQTDIRVLIEAEADEAVQAGLARLTTEIETRLGEHVYGRDRARLEQVTVEKLQQQQLQVAVAEHDTGDATNQMLQSVPGAATTFTFLPVTSQEGIGRYLGMESPEDTGDLTRWCRLVAERLRQKLVTDLGLVIYKNVTPGGVQLLITLASAAGISVSQRSFGGHPGNIDHWAGTLGLVHLRRWLLAHYPD